VSDVTEGRSRALGAAREDDRGKATAIYVIYLVAIFTQLPFLIGVVLAYVFRGTPPAWLDSHFDKQIGLFWWFVLWSLIGWPLTFVLGIGFLILIPLHIWIFIRCVQGLARVNRGEGWSRL
jgi:uncharacterized membrane protein